MGQKINPNLFRLGVIKGWKSRWFSLSRYRHNLKEDMGLRSFIVEKLKRAGIEKVDIERSGTRLRVIVFSARPGFIIGRGGEGIDMLRKGLEKKLKELRGSEAPKLELKIDVEEVRRGDIPAAVAAQQIAEQIERRLHHRRVMKQTIEKLMAVKGVFGAKIVLSGRLGGAEIARTEALSKGRAPLHTLRADIDFAKATAFNTYGTVGIKVWIYRGDVLPTKQTQTKQ